VATSGLAERLGLPFRDLGRLGEALVHSSYPNEHPGSGVRSNERLEFLGDTVIGLVISEALHERYRDEDEGQLTARRAALVSTAALARFATRFGLGGYVVLGHGAERTGTRTRPSVLAAVFEALTAAIYLELGLAATRAWLLEVVAPELADPADAAAYQAPKSRLQTYAYATHGAAPTYRVAAVAGPDHARHFEVEVLLGGEVLGRGGGTSRRAAETRAAQAALAGVERTGSDDRLAPPRGHAPS